jgi:hypothetical protein
VRRGLASLEAVMATAVTFPMAALLFVWGLRACRQIYAIIGPSIGWPYL